jgi:hypothetical protein
MKRKAIMWLAAVFALTAGSACSRQEEARDPGAADIGQLVEVTAVHEHATGRHLFQISEKEIPSGWTTFRFVNSAPVDHFFLIWRYPEEGMAAAQAAGQDLLQHWYDTVATSFDGFDAYLAGEISLEDYSAGLVERLQANAPWFLDPGAAPMGGPGLTAAGTASQTTVHLEPGEYIVECYVRDENGVFHSAVGMLDHMTVTTENSGAPAPSATATVTISSTEGITVRDTPAAGPQVVQVVYEDQAVYAHFLGHNVQLVRLQDKDDDEALRAIAQWMDWRHPTGLVNRAPAGARFMGGVMEMTAGATAYLHVEFAPGDYAWIAEVPDPDSQGMLRTFAIH